MKTLITGAFTPDSVQMGILEQMGLELTLQADERAQTLCPQQYEAVICNGLFLYNPLKGFESLRLLQLTSAGLDRVPLDEIQRRGIALFNARGVYSIPMAEFALSSVLQLYKQAAFFHDNRAAGQWQKHRSLRELYAKQVCVVGCGSVGTECARRFAAMGCEVTGIDVFPVKDRAYKQVLSLQELNLLLPDSDILILTVPLSEQTRQLMNEKRFSLMKPDAVLVNIARGGVVDTEALCSYLQSNPDSGAAIDVCEPEPLPPEHPLWHMSNALVTPHNSFVGEHNTDRLFSLICANIQKWRAEA